MKYVLFSLKNNKINFIMSAATKPSVFQWLINVHLFNCLPFDMSQDKRRYQENMIFPYFSMKTCCGYTLEAPRRGASNVYRQHMFSWKNQKLLTIFD